MKTGLLLMLGFLVCGVVVLADSDANQTEAEIGREIETFEQTEKKFKINVGNLVKKMLPYLLRGGSDAKISGPCTSSIMKIIGGVRQLKEWAVRFIDATGKIPAGVLEGTSLAIGDYDECLDIEVGKKDTPPKTPEEVIFRGQYCLLENHRPESIQRSIEDFQSGNEDASIAKSKTFLNMLVRYKHLTNSTFKLGVCVPSKCTKEDLENILNTESLRSIGKISVSYCEIKEEKEKSISQLLILSILGIFLGFIILGTAADMYFRYFNNQDKKCNSEPLTYSRLIAKSTSLYSNAIDVLSTKNYHESLSCLCGIRTFVVILTIYSHTYGHLHTMHFQKFSKAANFIRFFDSFFFAGITNGSVGMDTIAFVAAVTITYNTWRFVGESGKVSVPIFKTLLQRYFRMSAAQLITICIFLLLPVFGSGPLWHAYNDGPLDNCGKYWWLNFLYISNFWSSQDVCLYHTWVLALIMQLTILGVFIVWLLNKSHRYGIFAMVVVIMAGIIGVGVMTAIHNLPGGLAFFMHSIRTFPIAWRDVYILPYDHMGPFCIGLLVGYFLALKKDNLEISKIASIILWCSCFICNSAVMFGLYHYRHGEKIDQSLSTFYAVMHRNVWALGIGWLIIACTTHHGGPVSRVLKANIFVPLDRLCYMAYMLHIPIMYYHSGVIRERWFMGHMEVFFLAIAYVTISFFFSFMVHITFAGPYFAMEEHVISFFKTRNKVGFEPNRNMRAIEPTNASVLTLQDIESSNGCVNTAYSKTRDGF